MTNSGWTRTQGAVHVYTGAGKGKTTAALGLALRAAGAGLRVCFIQFLKGGLYAEHKALARLDNITLQRFGRARFVLGAPTDKDREEAQHGWEAVQYACRHPGYDLVVADEILMAQALGLLQEGQVLQLMAHKLTKVELVLTGRDATKKIMARADLVTEMKARKHYYTQGRAAKKGVEY